MIIQDCVLDLKRYWAPYGSVMPPTGWADVSGYGNDMADAVAPAEPDWVQLSSGLWYKDFDGDDYGTITDAPSININTEDFTIMFWQFTSVKSMPIIGKYQDANNRWYVQTDGNGYIFMYGRTTAQAGIFSILGTVDAAAGLWTQVAVTGIRGTQGFVYVNGVECTSGTNTCLANDATNTGGLTPGQYTVSYHTGGITLLRMFKGAMNADQVNAKFASERHWFDGA